MATHLYQHWKARHKSSPSKHCPSLISRPPPVLGLRDSIMDIGFPRLCNVINTNRREQNYAPPIWPVDASTECLALSMFPCSMKVRNLGASEATEWQLVTLFSHCSFCTKHNLFSPPDTSIMSTAIPTRIKVGGARLSGSKTGRLSGTASITKSSDFTIYGCDIRDGL